MSSNSCIGIGLVQNCTFCVSGSPFGIFSLVATPIAEAGGGAAVLETFTAVGSYLMTVLGGLVIHSIALFYYFSNFSGKG